MAARAERRDTRTMNTNETPQPGPDAAKDRPEQEASQGAERPVGEGFFNWLRGLGVSRPSERWLGGVAAGLANRAGIDPLIVRGVFIALAIVGGPGVLLYAVGWFLLPDSQGRIEAERLFRGAASGLAITLAIVVGVLVLLPALGGIGGIFTGGISTWDLWGNIGMPQWIVVIFTVLWWLALVAAIVWIALLIIARKNPHMSREEAEQRAAAWGERTAQQAADWGNSFGKKAEEWGQQASNWGEKAGQNAGNWGEKAGHKAGQWGQQAGEGAGQAAAYVSEWSAREHAEHLRSRLDPAHTILTLGLALLAAGAAAAVAAGNGANVLLAGIIAALAVMGLSLIVAGLRGRRSGWLGFWSFAGIVAMVWVAFVPANTQFVPFGDIDTRVTSAEVGSSTGIGLIFGTNTVDLSDLKATGGTVDAWVVAGNSKVILPTRDIPVQVEARTLAGQQITIDRDGKRSKLSSPLLFQTTGIDGRPGDNTPVTTVRVWVLAGNTTIDGVSEGSKPRATSDSNESMILEDAR